MRALFRGEGWGFGEGRGPEIFLEGEERTVRAERPEQLPDVLASLDEIASTGDPNLIAAGFISYEAGVFLEGSTALVRPHEFLPFAEFSVFDTRRSGRPSCRAAIPGQISSIHLRRTGDRGAVALFGAMDERCRGHPRRHRPRRRLPGQSLAPHALCGQRRSLRPRARPLCRQPRALRLDARPRRPGRGVELAGAFPRRGPRGAARRHEADQGHDRDGRDGDRGRRQAP